jgi:hypothetical protein
MAWAAPISITSRAFEGRRWIRGDDSDYVGGGAADPRSVVQVFLICAKHKLPRPAKLTLACCTIRTVIEYSA